MATLKGGGLGGKVQLGRKKTQMDLTKIECEQREKPLATDNGCGGER